MSIVNDESTHKEKMSEVFYELLIDHPETKECDNPDCDAYIIANDQYIEKNIIFHTFIFCCEDCAGYGEDAIRRSYRKRNKK